MFAMWNNWGFASSAASASVGSKQTGARPSAAGADYSDDEVPSPTSRDEGLECPICYESFNIVENVPYVLWCGHTLCKNCVHGLQWAVVKLPTVPVQLPLFISCPWCHLLSFRLVYKGALKFPRKNFFLLSMVESMNGDRGAAASRYRRSDHLTAWAASDGHHHHHQRDSSYARQEQSHRNQAERAGHFADLWSVERINSSLRRSLAFCVRMTAKLPLLIVFLLIVLYVIPASAAVLALYLLITVVFALPSFLILYFAYPSLDWIIREIIT